MTFAASDQLRLVKALDLTRNQMTATSMLKQLMNELERFDTANGTTFVAEVQNLLAEWEDLQAQIDESAADAHVKIIDVRTEIRTEFFGAGGAVAALQGKAASIIATIKKYLDPENWLDQYVNTARVIQTL